MRSSGVLRIVCCTLLLELTSSGQNVPIHYYTVAADEINRRLGEFKNTNSKRELELRALFEEVGCSGDRLTDQAVKHSHDPNVICALPGQTDSRIVVGGHFDFVDRGQGVVDNWSGCSLLPSLYQSLKTFPRRHTFVFVGFTDEEKGLVGSEFYVHQMRQPEIEGIRAMVNMDSLGTGPTKVELIRGDKQLANALGIVASSMHLSVSAVNVHQVGRSDSDSFQDRHVPTVNVHSLTNQTWPILHSRRDEMAAMRLSDYYDTYRLLAAYLAYLDVTLDAPSGAGN
jgi:Peptidase family M28